MRHVFEYFHVRPDPTHSISTIQYFSISPVCIIVLQKGQGPPGREPVFSEEQRKQMMAYAYRKQEELKVHPCCL